MDERIAAARRAYNAAVEARDAAYQALENLADDASEEELEAAQADFDDTQEQVERSQAAVKRLEQAKEARERTPAVQVAEPKNTPIQVVEEEKTYRPDTMSERSFFEDLLNVRSGDREAAERLQRNRREALDALGYREHRDMSNTSTAGSEFLPPLYLDQLWVGPNIAARPFADQLPKLPLPPFGTAISIPQLSSGVAVAARSDAGSVTETDGVTATISHTVNEIAGQVDVGRIAVSRSQPGLDQVIGRTLVRRYHAYLDTQLLSGTGSAPQHDGLDNVSGANSVSYTDASPTAAELVPKIYDCIQQNWDGRKGESVPDLIVMHPRRAAWLASNLSSTFPLFQLGGYTQASGSQAAGFVDNFAGLRVVLDPNVLTTYSAGGNTNEDRIYVVNSEDLILMEGPLQARVWDSVGSGTGVIRYQVFAESAFLSNRYPEAVGMVIGTGLVAPTF